MEEKELSRAQNTDRKLHADDEEEYQFVRGGAGEASETGRKRAFLSQKQLYVCPVCFRCVVMYVRQMSPEDVDDDVDGNDVDDDVDDDIADNYEVGVEVSSTAEDVFP